MEKQVWKDELTGGTNIMDFNFSINKFVSLITRYLNTSTFSIWKHSQEYRREQMNLLCSHYGNQINDVYQDDSAPAEAIISTVEQEREIKQKDIHKYLKAVKPTLMCSEGSVRNFPNNINF